MMVKNNHDLQGLMRIGEICGETLKYMLEQAEPGMSTKQLDDIGAEFLKKHGAVSAPIAAYNYPSQFCISLNDEAAHGPANPDKIIREGDLLNVDVSAVLEGYWGDCGASVAITPATKDRQRLLRYTKEALDKGITEARAGQPLSNIGKAIQSVAKKGNYQIIRELGGHGVGRHIHEPPSILNFPARRNRQQIEDGMVFTIEPFLNMGKGRIYEEDDGWTLRTVDHSLVAQYEHTVIVNGDHPILVTKNWEEYFSQN